MFQVLHNVNIDWMGNRRWFIGASVLLMMAGLGSAIIRQATGRQAFNLGVDFKGGTVVTARFKQRPSDDQIRATLVDKGINDAVVQPVTDRPDTVLIKVPLEGEGQDGRVRVREALNQFGTEAAATSELEADPNAAYKIVGTDAVGAIAGAQLGF
jgi:preprotein translocase subunit SecF